MTDVSHKSAFELLTSIARRSEAVEVTLPAQTAIEGQWRGVGFRLAGIDFIAPLTDVDELLYMPECTRFPGVQAWVNGVANVRGRLLSVIDLGMFFQQKPSVSSKKCRVLTVKRNDLYTGVIVEEVLGMQSFTDDARVHEVQVADPFKPFVEGGFKQDTRSWTIFSLSSLVQAPEFLQVAV